MYSVAMLQQMSGGGVQSRGGERLSDKSVIEWGCAVAGGIILRASSNILSPKLS